MIDIVNIPHSFTEAQIQALRNIYRESFAIRFPDSAEEEASGAVERMLNSGYGMVACLEGNPIGFLRYTFLESSMRLFQEFQEALNFAHDTGFDKKRSLDILSRTLDSDENCSRFSSPDPAERQITDISKGLTVVAVRGDDVCKTATAITAPYRGNGIATKFNAYLEMGARHRGIHHIFTTCTEDPAILSLNQQRGYQEIIRVSPFYADGSSATFMVKDLTRG